MRGFCSRFESPTDSCVILISIAAVFRAWRQPNLFISSKEYDGPDELSNIMELATGNTVRNTNTEHYVTVYRYRCAVYTFLPLTYLVRCLVDVHT